MPRLLNCLLLNKDNRFEPVYYSDCARASSSAIWLWNVVISLKFRSILDEMMTTVTKLVVFIVQKISCKSGLTSGLFRHLKSNYNLSFERKDQPWTSKKAKLQQKSILPFVNAKKESLLNIVSQLAAVGGFSIHFMGKSKFIRESLSAKGFCLPPLDSSNINLIHSEYNDIQKEIKAKTEIKVKANARFSVTMGEYTSVCCRRYMNINAHCQNDVINLGLIIMLESCGAEKIIQLLEKHLADF